ncbi:MAG: glycosyltransferase family 2 protein [Candidatus Caenarcaniphilales bacterium]|nr:glycosyltransferase family 2 protein [Candidatus Caenarcaniphilales bacterium]
MKISLAICSYNRYEKLIVLLGALKKQIEANAFAAKSIERSFELIVIDNNSIDETKSLKHFSIKDNEYKYLVEMKPGLSAARNKALREFTGDLICFLDDDILIQPNFISNLLKISKRSLTEIGIVGARVKLPKEIKDSDLLKKYKLISQSVFPEHDYGSFAKKYPFQEQAKFVENPIGACFLMSRNTVDNLSMFNENIGVGAKKFGETLHEDTEFFRRAINKEISLEYIPELCVEHPLDDDRLDTKRIYNWYFNSGKSFVLLAKHKPEIFAKKNQAELIGVPNALLKLWPSFLNFEFLEIPFYMHFKLVIVYFLSILVHLTMQEQWIVFYKAQFFKTMGEITGFRLVKQVEA